MRQFMASLSVEAFDLKVVKPQADEPLSNMLSSSQWGLGGACHSPGPWGAEQSQAGAGSTTGAGASLPTTGSFKKSGLGPVSTAWLLQLPCASEIRTVNASCSTVLDVVQWSDLSMK